MSIDARLQEPGWQHASVVSNFKQLEPDEGAAASQRTEVRILYGENALYVGATLHDEEPEKIQATLGRRDDINRADWFFISIDSYFDQETAYTFGVNAAGIQFDGLRTDQELDNSWDAIWTSKVRVADEGWVAELRIPYSMLRFSEAESQTWGVQFTRRIPRLSERDEWPLVPQAERANLVARYARLQGITGIEPQRNVQLRPYALSRARTEEVDPNEVDASGTIKGGGDLLVGLASNITLNATINPDFGQVESDPAVLNLSAFETFFPEKRPFFIEGTQIFDYSLGRDQRLLYTRRIGATSPIVGASKLSGRTSQGLSFGALGATTGEHFQPTRHYGALRMKQEFGVASYAGGIFTAFNAPASEGRRTSLVGGADWDWRFIDNTYQLNGFASLTHQRDPALRETGLAASLNGGKIRGNWSYAASATLFDDDFDPNEMGRLRRNNYFRLSGDVQHALNDNRPSRFDVPTSTQLADTFELFPTNVFLIKLDYTILF